MEGNDHAQDSWLYNVLRAAKDGMILQAGNKVLQCCRDYWRQVCECNSRVEYWTEGSAAHLDFSQHIQIKKKLVLSPSSRSQINPYWHIGFHLTRTSRVNYDSSSSLSSYALQLDEFDLMSFHISKLICAILLHRRKSKRRTICQIRDFRGKLKAFPLKAKFSLLRQKIQSNAASRIKRINFCQLRLKVYQPYKKSVVR